jgi:hypothetical protein
MHDPQNIPLADIRIYESEELVFDGSDPDTYIVIDSPEQLAAVFAQMAADGAA